MYTWSILVKTTKDAVRKLWNLELLAAQDLQSRSWVVLVCMASSSMFYGEKRRITQYTVIQHSDFGI
jgi:hypothetical protein